MKKNKKDQSWCCWGSDSNKSFPTFAVVILAIGILWLLQELGYVAQGFSWWPIILIVVALGWIIDNKQRKR